MTRRVCGALVGRPLGRAKRLSPKAGKRIVTIALAVGTLSSVGCGGKEGLNGSSTCQQWAGAAAVEQGIYTESIHPNARLAQSKLRKKIDAQCASESVRHIGEVAG
jgi:hypothetical protein